MSVSRVFREIFRYRKTNLSVLFVATYILAYILYYFDISRYKHSIPINDKGDSARSLLENAWLDLQEITVAPHPYTSHENDKVHDYLLERVDGILSGCSFGSFTDDYKTKSSSLFQEDERLVFTTKQARVVYFESSNILAKLEGKNPNLPGLLLSAHFDSVPTSNGATDDGKGIASLLALLDYYSKLKPERTMIFNFNNNEEFGLLGATHFTTHPWFKLVHYVINLEGTGTGGKSVLVRTSDVTTANIYKNAVKTEPFGNSIFQEGMNNKIVSSETDYRVYDFNGLKGWDIAFYRPRSLYHTAKDNIAHTSRDALWHMLSTAWQISDYLMTYDESTVEYDGHPAVYFDFYGLFFCVIGTYTLFVCNTILLVFVPIVFLVLYYIDKRRYNSKVTRISSWLILPFSLIVAGIFVKFFQILIAGINPNIVGRDYFSPFFSIATGVLITNYLITSFFNYFVRDESAKDVALIELTFISWVLLLFASWHLKATDYGSTSVYPFSILFFSLSFATLVSYIISVIFLNTEKTSEIEILDEGSISRESYHSMEQRSEVDVASPTSAGSHSIEGIQSNQEDDERAPLIATGNKVNLSSTEHSSSNYKWSLQYLLLVPCILFSFQTLMITLSAVSQTILDAEKSVSFVWDILFWGTIFVCLPLLPFVKVRFWLLVTWFVIAVFCSTQSLLAPPFIPESPLKVRFAQNMNGTVELTSAVDKGQFLKDIIVDLPSFKNNNISFSCQKDKCSYEGLKPNLIDINSEMDNNGPNDLSNNMMRLDVISNDRLIENRSKYAPLNAKLKIKVKDNRACNVVFNSSSDGYSLVKEVTIYGKNGHKNIKVGSGITELNLHKLSFDTESYEIGIQWFPKILSNYGGSSTKQSDKVIPDNDDDELGISVTCFWGEFDSESIIHGEHKRKVPAYDEVIEYSAPIFSFTNKYKGLVYSEEYIEL